VHQTGVRPHCQLRLGDNSDGFAQAGATCEIDHTLIYQRARLLRQVPVVGTAQQNNGEPMFAAQ
jgi:hypothetical protein